LVERPQFNKGLAIAPALFAVALAPPERKLIRILNSSLSDSPQAEFWQS
jgi:hypothetical protein